ncbi:hypothetical protein Ssi03_12320 [Sphaerisporangium siamense]|uniref:DUF4082 domain-containing protein n=1 Tax=Sphaerisporangium siamense TaxID=795645 RepID=A0A7W7GB26_9ACTN|nr:DUF4082 domain-containing protein [Sphaerisporangium siamense]MBB4702997.1 hypothetical protein [Sphaerisporangium siamense]GII83242.1 hypothetical protein Ssi03_12320 [Sphaerisporangium siamense]
MKYRTPFRAARPGAGRAWVTALTAVFTTAVLLATPLTANAARRAPVNLGSAASFAVLGGSAVNNNNFTAVTGDLGVSPGSTVTGFPPGTVTGTTHAGDATAATARTAMLAAYNDIAGRTPVTTVAAELGGTTKGPGIYTPTGGAFTITGTLTLDAQGEPDAEFIFTSSTLTTATVSNIALINGAQAKNVFWQATDSATLGVNSTFRGTVMAANTAQALSGASVFGRLFTINANVILAGTTNGPATRIAVPVEPATTTTLSSSANPVARNQVVTFTATVSAVSGSLVPQGQVLFKEGTTTLGSGFLDASGVATFSTSSLSVGTHQVQAVYLGGDTFDHEALVHFAPSKSSVLAQNVSASLWSSTTTPAVASYQDNRAVVVGVKFRATTAGTVSGIRFYKGAQNTGAHVGTLWTGNGTSLASATFTGETASGWQQANFASPVAISANTTYVASCLTNVGFYSVTRPYFTVQYDNAPLLAPADGADGGNGVYQYGGSNAFPTNTFQASNYWIDVVFTPSSA